MLKISSILELIKNFPDEESCITHLENVIWNGVPVSPFNKSSKVYKCKNGKYKCKETNRYFNILTGSVFENTKIPLQKWFIALYLFTNTKKGISSYQLQRELGVTQKTAWFMLHRLRNAFKVKTFQDNLSGTIECDETFVGGKNKNRHKDKKVPQSQGRSFKDKTPILGMLERETSVIIERRHKVIQDRTVRKKIVTKPARLLCYVVKDTKIKSIQPIIKNKVNGSSILNTDEWSGYKGLNMFYSHSIVDHTKKQYVNGDTTTNRIEGCWSHFKRNIIGIYHNVSRKHLQRYTDEYTLRYNTRNLTFMNRFDLIINSTSNKRLTYKQLVNGTGF